MDSDGDDIIPSWDHKFIRILPRVRNNDPSVKRLYCDEIQIMTNAEWEDIGRDISNNSYLEELTIIGGVLNDETLSSLFRGLSRSSSISYLDLGGNECSAAGLRSLEPFLQNSIKLRGLDVSFTSNIQTEGFNILMQVLHDSPIERLDFSHCGITSIEIETVPTNLQLLRLSGNDIKSEGFNRLLRSLHDSSIEYLYCISCCIGSIEVDANSFPRSLKTLHLDSNKINSNGCHEIAKLLQEGDTKLQILKLGRNLIGDEGVAILVDALKSNTSLKFLNLELNDGISDVGRIMMLKLVNDISSIKATLQSNHTLQTIRLGEMNDDIHQYINMATTYNNSDYSVEAAAGREKVIQTQLHSQTRAKLAEIQGVQHSLYSEINPLHLPEVLSLVSRRHGQEELYVALKASIAEVISTVDRKRCLLQQRDYHVAKTKQINAELERIEAADSAVKGGNNSNKRRRK